MLWERLHFLRGYEDVLTEIMLDTPEINRIADMVAEYMEGCVRHSLSLGVDAVQFGDDFGTQRAPIFPPEVWRRFIKPRYKRIIAPIRSAGARVFFHSCGQIAPLLDDLADLGVTAVWPQLPLFDKQELSRRCRGLGIAVMLHPDRGELMQRAAPEQVRPYVERLIESFDTPAGGSWLYVEIDPGFRWENVQALFDVCRTLRRQAP
jgi:uroporphyrinogen-III decarboxylase